MNESMEYEDIDISNITHITSRMPIISKHPALGILLSTFTVATICGNTLVISAVICRRNLHTPTGYLVLSLAMADLIVGLGVMPLNVLFEMYDHVWMFSLAVCDLWHSLDVLASTASIWNLCVIAMDRCLAVSDPLNYPDLMSLHRVTICICIVWLGSAVIAFPAVAWWRNASPELYDRSDRCLFTNDTGYLIFSSLLSFYIPLLIIVGAYGRVYVIAYRHQRSLSEGRKALACNPSIYIRVHRGGRTPILNCNGNADQTQIPSSAKPASALSSPQWSRAVTVSQASDTTALIQTIRQNYGSYEIVHSKMESQNSSVSTAAASSTPRTSRSDSAFSRRSRASALSIISTGDSTKRKRKPRATMLLRLLAKESKAAKTLGIVVGAFIACWLPFFVVNVLSGACGEDCSGFRLTFTIVTWLGHCNSFLNPIIYTCFNREFRDAFAYVLFCGHWTRRGRAYARRRRLRNFATATGQTFCASKGLAKAIEGGLRVIVPQATNSDAVVLAENKTAQKERDPEEDVVIEKDHSDDTYSFYI